MNDKMVELRHALHREGYLDRTLQRARELRPGLQIDAIRKLEEVIAEVAEGGSVHPDVLKMRKLKAEIARRDQEMDDEEMDARECAAKGLVEFRPARRVHRSTATLSNAHCRICGHIGHRQDGCPKVQEQLALQAQGLAPVPRTSQLEGAEKSLARVVAHLKYTWIEQRSSAYDARRPRAQEGQCVTGHQLCRMSARDMCDFSQQCELLDLAQDSFCQNPRCAEYAEKWGQAWTKADTNTLGHVRARTDVFEVSGMTAWRWFLISKERLPPTQLRLRDYYNFAS